MADAQPKTRAFAQHKTAQTGVDRSKAAKLFIDNYYKDLIGQQGDRVKRQEQLQQETQGLNPQQQKEAQLALQQAETEMLRQRRNKISVRDFENIKLIGRGAFGEVRVVAEKNTKPGERKIFAMKIMNKEFVIAKNQLAHARAERDAMIENMAPGIVELHYSFQDTNFLYFVMEYLPGGDLMNMLLNKHFLPEDACKFYIFEIICAVQHCHERGYIHRDLKPDNILIARDGHIKLTDFGLCTSGAESHLSSFYQAPTKSSLGDTNARVLERGISRGISRDERTQTWNRMRREKSYSTVGTSNYMAPEILLEQGYEKSVDWWAVGIILYECLVGYAPFSCEDPTDTCLLILDWQNSFEFPEEDECVLTKNAKDLILRLVTDPKQRIQFHEQIKHPWFAGFDPKTIYQTKAPWIPEIKSLTDTSNFDEFEDNNFHYFFGDGSPDELASSSKPMKELDEKQLPFVGWTYRRFDKKTSTKPRVDGLFDTDDGNSAPGSPSPPLRGDLKESREFKDLKESKESEKKKPSPSKKLEKEKSSKK